MRVQAKGCGSAPGSFLAGLGRVETVFPAAVNIRTLNGFCLSVVDERADLAPNRIILPLGRLKKLPFRPGQTVEIKAVEVVHQDFTILFSPAPQQAYKVSVPSDLTLVYLRKALEAGQGACLAFLGEGPAGFLEQSAADLGKKLAADLSAGFSLIGLGGGYTPAGDDILTGFSALAKRLGFLDQEWHQEIVAKALVETNSLSATGLYFAGLGQVQGYLDQVLSSLDDFQRLKAACLKLITSVGTTSGSDLLLGVLIGCLAHNKVRRDNNYA